MAPKTSTTRLCSGNVKGLAISSETRLGVPEERIPSLSKALNQQMKNKITELISLLERRSRIHIEKFVCVFAVEEKPQNVVRIWLHHVKEVATTRRRTAPERGFSEKQSTTSHLTHVSGCGLRKVKCVGDFCGYIEAFDSFIEEEEDEDRAYGHSEFREAIKRNRRPSEGDVVRDPEAEEILRQQQEVIEVATGQANNASPEGLASMVKMKSITLARREMAELDANRSVSTWPKDLELWYKRVGHNAVKRKLAQIPVSSAHAIGKSMVNPEEDITAKAASPMKLRTLTKKSLERGLVEDASHAIPYDLTDNSYAPAAYSAKTGQLSWYYSDAPVCSRCYKVYKELDRNREVFLTAELQKKQAEELAQMDAYYAAQQQQSARRLAKAKKARNTKKNVEADEPSLHRIAPPPDRVLPLMPWQLQGQEKIKKYSQASSAFIRNIGGKAHRIRELARQDINEVAQDDSALDPDFDWRNIIRGNAGNSDSALQKSQSAGQIDRQKHKTKTKHIVKKQFDPNRLLHSYQRDLAQLRKELGNEEEHTVPDAKPVYIAKEKPKKTNFLETVQKKKKRVVAVPDDSVADFTSGPLPPLPMHVVKDKLAEMNERTRKPDLGTKQRLEKQKPLPSTKSLQSLITKGVTSFDEPPPKSFNTTLPAPQSLSETKAPKSALKQTRFHPSLESKSPVKTSDDEEEEEGEEGDEEEDDDDDDGIGWSPFTVVA